VKRIVISVSILLVFLFTLTQNFAAEKSNKSESASKDKKEQKSEDKEERMRRYLGNFRMNDTEAVKVPKVKDPNVPEAESKKFEGLEEKIAGITKESQREISEWLNTRAKSKIGLARAVQRQVMAELNLIRELAVEEEAVKTTAAIDSLLVDRKERFNKMLEKLKENEKKERTSERGNRRDVREGRSTRGRDRDRGRTNKRSDRENRQSDRDRYLSGR